jgi:hypothetical protein
MKYISHLMLNDRSRSSPNKTAGESKPETYPLEYVEGIDDPRTQLAAIFSGC